MSRALELTKLLISKPSVTPNDAGCQLLISDRLYKLGFTCETITSNNVTNLWATRNFFKKNTVSPRSHKLIFAGHTDVVPTGPIELWNSPPFKLTQHNNMIYGRGIADMKASIACFIVAIEEFIATTSNHMISLGVLLTSDEEGNAHDGTSIVVDKLLSRGEVIEYCIVGEPTSVNKLGDTIKNGRRGSLNGKITAYGIQGHIAYLDKKCNPIHLIIPVLNELNTTIWDQGNQYFLPTTFQISNINAGTGTNNIIPNSITINFNFRFSTENSSTQLINQVESCLAKYGLINKVNCSITWTCNAQPFLTKNNVLSKALTNAILDETGLYTQLSTTGGTSDARFLFKIAKEVIEFGPINESIHKVNECLPIDSIESLKNIYLNVIKQLAV